MKYLLLVLFVLISTNAISAEGTGIQCTKCLEADDAIVEQQQNNERKQTKLEKALGAFNEKMSAREKSLGEGYAKNKK